MSAEFPRPDGQSFLQSDSSERISDKLASSGCSDKKLESLSTASMKEYNSNAVARADKLAANASLSEILWVRIIAGGLRHSSLAPRNLNELPTTLTDDKLIAAAAIIGDSTKPKKG